MSVDTRRPRLATVAAALAGAAGLCALVLPLSPAQAQVPYLGIDFGNGWGIGLGPPPSAYGMAVASPWAPFYYPHSCWDPYYRHYYAC